MLMFINEVKSCESFPSMRKDVLTPVAILRQLANFEKKNETMAAVAMDSDTFCSASANEQRIAASFQSSAEALAGNQASNHGEVDLIGVVEDNLNQLLQNVEVLCPIWFQN